MIKALALAPLFVLVGMLAGIATAHDYQIRSLKIDHPYARATPLGAQTGGVFLTVENKGAQTDRLLRASSSIAGAVTLHEMRVDGGVMRMREVAGLDVAPGDALVLKPGGYHVMLSALKHPLKSGDRFPLTLAFEKAGTIEISVWVEDLGAGADTAH